MRSRLILLPFAALVACGGGGADTTGPGTGGTGTGGSNPVATTSVEMQANKFAPTSIRVAPSATVTWTNSDGYAHNVVFGGNVGTIAAFDNGNRSLQMPSAAGTYSYTCNLHAGMSGSVTVQ